MGDYRRLPAAREYLLTAEEDRGNDPDPESDDPDAGSTEDSIHPV